MTTTDQDLRALTYLARRLRDETHGCAKWDEAGTFEVLKQTLAGQNLLISIQRVLGHATDTDAQTPGAIKRPFVPEPAVVPEPRKPYDPANTCAVCSRTKGACEGTARWAGDDHVFRAARRHVADPEKAAEARAAARLALASTEVCSHGVAPLHCVDHRETATSKGMA